MGKEQLNVRVDSQVKEAARTRAAELGQPIGVFVERALRLMLGAQSNAIRTVDDVPKAMETHGRAVERVRREFRPDPKPTKKP